MDGNMIKYHSTLADSHSGALAERSVTKARCDGLAWLACVITRQSSLFVPTDMLHL